MVLQVGYVSCDVYGCHRSASLAVAGWPAACRYRRAVDADPLLGPLRAAAGAVADALATLDDLTAVTERPGQYRLDLVADAAALEVLHGAGLSVLSEESGRSGKGPLLAVLDPVDGSTNASRGIPFYSTSVCVLDAEGPRVALVVNHATGVRYEAVRGMGAWRDGEPVAPSGCQKLADAVVGISGLAERYLGWAQYRALGAASLELCAVADGSLDAYLQLGGARIFPWDYLGGLLVCQEAGAPVVEVDGRELLVTSPERRWPLAAATAALLDQLLAAMA